VHAIEELLVKGLSNTANAAGSGVAGSSIGDIEAKTTIAVPSTASGRSASVSRAVATRSTVKIRRQSAIVGEMPAAWATDRKVPRPSIRLASRAKPSSSVTSSTNGSADSSAAAAVTASA
jgi:hypothetical protein